MNISNPLVRISDRVTSLETTGVPEADIDLIVERVLDDVDKTTVGLGNVDNTSDAEKAAGGPIADALSFKWPTVNAKKFGATGGGADDTVPLQNAIDAAKLLGAELLIPEGIYYHTGLTITPPFTMKGEGLTKTVLVLKANSNTDAITVNYTATGANFGPQHLHMEDLQISGNRTNQTSGGLIRFVDGPTGGPGTEYGMSMFGRNLYLTSAKNDGILVGNNRNYGILENCEIEFCDRDGIRLLSSGDWRLDRCDIGGCLGEGFNNVGGFAVILDTCNLYSNSLRGFRAQPTSSDFVLSNCNFDRNGENGVSIEGNTTSQKNRIVSGCQFTLNSRSATGVHSDIKVFNANGGVVTGNRFTRNDDNQPKYLVEFLGTNDAIIFAHNDYSRANPPWVTAITNDFSKLLLLGDRSTNLALVDADTWKMTASGVEVFRVNSTKSSFQRRIDLEHTAPAFIFNETDAAVDWRKWRLDADSNRLRGFAMNDAESTLGQWLEVQRSGAAITRAALYAAGSQRLEVNTNGVKVVLPTSASGLTTGQLWNNSGVVNIIP